MNLDDPKLLHEAEAIKRWFNEGPQRLRDERDQMLRDLATRHNLRPVDLATVTGYSRETIRQALNPTKRDEIKGRRRSEEAQEAAYHAARDHIDLIAVDEILRDRAARDAVAVLASIDPQDDAALRRIAEAIAATVPTNGAPKMWAVFRAIQAAHAVLHPGD